ncbi:unnamed protein product [Coregonus sp. 'balchen']|nr:unnamed protein product [Coregonus sp. 'balchen']
MSGEEAPVQQQQEPTEEKTENPPTEEPPSEAAQEGEPSPAEEPVDEPAAATPDKAPVAPEEEVFTYRALFLTGYGGYDKVKLQMKKGKPEERRGAGAGQGVWSELHRVVGETGVV